MKQRKKKQLRAVMKVEKLDNGMTSYTAKIPKGYLGDQAVEWFTEEDWAKHRKYVAELEANGEYGKLEEVTIIMKDHPEFDKPSPQLKDRKLESYRMVMLDLSKEL